MARLLGGAGPGRGACRRRVRSVSSVSGRHLAFVRGCCAGSMWTPPSRWRSALTWGFVRLDRDRGCRRMAVPKAPALLLTVLLCRAAALRLRRPAALRAGDRPRCLFCAAAGGTLLRLPAAGRPERPGGRRRAVQNRASAAAPTAGPGAPPSRGRSAGHRSTTGCSTPAALPVRAVTGLTSAGHSALLLYDQRPARAGAFGLSVLDTADHSWAAGRCLRLI